MRVQFIKAADTYPLRLKVLRPGGIEEDVHFANDRLEGAFHLGVSIGGHRICVGSFYPEAHPELSGWKQFRLRGMATRIVGYGECYASLLLDTLLIAPTAELFLF